jgi:hypothetical protein
LVNLVFSKISVTTRSGVGIRNCAPNPLRVSIQVSKLITMIIKKEKSNTQFWYIYNHSSHKIKLPIGIIYNHGSQKKIEKKKLKYIRLKLRVFGSHLVSMNVFGISKCFTLLRANNEAWFCINIWVSLSMTSLLIMVSLIEIFCALKSCLSKKGSYYRSIWASSTIIYIIFRNVEIFRKIFEKYLFILKENFQWRIWEYISFFSKWNPWN